MEFNKEQKLAIASFRESFDELLKNNAHQKWYYEYDSDIEFKLGSFAKIGGYDMGMVTWCSPKDGYVEFVGITFEQWQRISNKSALSLLTIPRIH